jgi:predicted transcriptional regulator
MGKSKRPVLDVLFPEVRSRLLGILWSAPCRPRYVRELMGLSGLALHTVQDELRKLSAAGLITSWSNGYHRFYRANPNHPLFSTLANMVRIGAKLRGVTPEALNRRHSPRSKRTQRSRRPRPLPANWPGKWHLFSEKKSRRL